MDSPEADGVAGGVVTSPPRPRRPWLRLLGLLVLVGVLAGVGLAAAVILSGRHVAAASEGRGYAVEDVPEVPVAMVLGAKADPGRPSAFLAARLDLAVELWGRGAIRAVLVSGDGTSASNNETGVMHDYLVARGVPADKVVQDPAGFDTYDSCVRARDVFGVQEMVILTQEYHLARALTICQEVGIRSVGVGDISARDGFPDLYARGEAREWLANLKMEWDLFTNREPQQDPFDPSLLEAAGVA